MTDKDKTPRVGKLRSSQVVTQHGPGAVVDLPDLSVIVGSTDHWRPNAIDRVTEPRLEAALEVRTFYRPPVPERGKFGGVPAYLFPEWLVCPIAKCRLLAHHSAFHWSSNQRQYLCPRDDRHPGNLTPSAFPARFLVACSSGHVDDFPWETWAHGDDTPCGGPLQLIDNGRSGSANDLEIRCEGCSAKKSLGRAFRRDAHDLCGGRRPWFGPTNHETKCPNTPRTILRGASNAYFPIVASALSIPPWSDPIEDDLLLYRDALLAADTIDKLRAGIEGGFYPTGDLTERYSIEQIWQALHAEVKEEGLRPDEYRVFLDPPPASVPPAQFEVETRDVPEGFTNRVRGVRAARRLREVRALRGFTRIDSGVELGESADVAPLDLRVAHIGPKNVDWLPGTDLRGEGVFIELDEAAIAAWEARPAVTAMGELLQHRFSTYLTERDREDRPFPGMRYVLLHTLAHVLIRTLSLDAGYSSSALRERLYCAGGDEPMAGLLVYTASNDSDGSLGGLVDQADPDRLGPVLAESLREAALCASDPLCGGGDLHVAGGLNGAACHACLLLAETSCEIGNHFLDRAVLIATLGRADLAYFDAT